MTITAARRGRTCSSRMAGTRSVRAVTTTYWRRPGKDAGSGATTNHAGSDLLWCSRVRRRSSRTRATRSSACIRCSSTAATTRRPQRAAAQGYGEQSAVGARPRRQRAPSADQSAHSRLTPASAITIRPVRWLWEDRLSLGSSAAGRPRGYRQNAPGYTLAADVTRGTLPGVYAASRGACSSPPPRIAGNTRSRPGLWRRGGSDAGLSCRRRRAGRRAAYALAAAGCGGARPAAREVGCRASFLDPLLSRLDARLDTHKDAEVRRALEPLSAMADAANLSVLGLMHVNKSASSDALNLLMASRAFPAVARNVLFVMTIPDHESQRLVGQAKNNLGRMDLPTLVFKVDNTLVATTPEGPVWTGKLPGCHRRLAACGTRLNGPGSRTRPDGGSGCGGLARGLTSRARGVPLLPSHFDAGQTAGHSRRTLYRANERSLSRATIAASHGRLLAPAALQSCHQCQLCQCHGLPGRWHD